MTSVAQRPVRFLLVEDDDDHADLVQRAMRGSNVVNEVFHVVDGEAALQFLQHEPPYESSPRPDVVLLDLKLPRVSGLDVLETIKNDKDLCTIPVVVLTTSEAETDRARAYAASANSYLAKPADFERFHEMIVDLQMYWTIWNRPPAA